MARELCEQIYDRFFDELKRLAPDDTPLIDALAQLRSEGRLDQEPALAQVYRRLAEEA